MSIKFSPSEEKPALRTHDVIIDGVKVGTVEPSIRAYSGEISWLCSIKGEYGVIGMIYGSGPSMPASVENAVFNGWKESTAGVAAAEKLAATLGIDLNKPPRLQ